MQDYNQAAAFVQVLTGSPETVIDWRAIHDRDKATAAIIRRGSLSAMFAELSQWNAAGYGIFAMINETDGNGRKLENLMKIRAQFIDLDNLSAAQNYARAAQWNPKPAFAVQSSPNKFHIYWPVAPYLNIDAFKTLQRKLVQYFESDAKVIDAAHVMRVPGFYHCKGEPFLSQVWALDGMGLVTPQETLEHVLQGINVIDSGYGLRRPLGDAELAAPSLEWLQHGLMLTNPNSLDRAEWISITAAFKQAGWSLTEPDKLLKIWLDWCVQYTGNDQGENIKQWNDLTETQLGWKSLVNKTPALKAYLHLGGKNVPAPKVTDAPAPGPMPQTPTARDGVTDEILTPDQQAQYFEGCYSIITTGEILTPKKLLLKSGAFNAEFGGKIFIISSTGKTTDEPYKAATRGTVFRIPRVDKLRFLPHMKPNTVVVDELGRSGINTYLPAKIERRSGDVSPFLRHLELILPDANDRHILLQFMASNAQFPGRKIPWSILIQSTEGAGKGVFKEILSYIVGRPYFYSPKAKDLAESGAKFNEWMADKLMIVVDEIRVDEKRELVEVLKEFISETEVELQGKGTNQKLGDNYANWLFFSNWKDAIPINKNSRRYAIMYSAIQSLADLVARGMDDNYFTWLRDWQAAGGNAIIYDYLMNFPIGKLPSRAPVTSSTADAVHHSFSSLERLILDAVADGVQGFRNGWVSTAALTVRMRALGSRQVQPVTLEKVLEGLGYRSAGRAQRSYLGEDANLRGVLYHISPGQNVADYARAQGYSE